MTALAADVCFVLESVRGVVGVYAIDARQRVSVHLDYAVEIERSGRTLAEAHYALLRLMTHEECARVYFFFAADVPQVVLRGARLLTLTSGEREAARRRVPPPTPREPLPVGRTPTARELSPGRVLLVDDDEATLRVVTAVVGAESRLVVTSSVDRAVTLAAELPFDLILCDVKRAFGSGGLLAKLPLETASRVLVLAARSELVDARWRLQGISRIVAKPVKAWILRERILRAAAGAVSPLWAPELARARMATGDRPRRLLSTPPATAPFTVVLADVDHDTHDALRRILRKESRHLLRHDPDDAAEIALSTPAHLVVCSVGAALHPRSFLDAIGREDPAGADRVLVVAPSRDVSYVRHKLGEMRRKNTVLALPIDDVLLGREIFRHHPTLVAQVAVAEIAAVVASAGAAAPLERPRFRRLALLVVDDDMTTQILFAAASPRDDADVALATTPMEAFEHVVSRPVDLLVVSATMRGDGGEPFYRVLWRLKPELKTRCVLLTPPDASPPSAPRSHPPRIVERPLIQSAITRIVEAFARPLPR